MRDRRGFTLIELMVVVAILGVLATAAMAVSRNSRGRAELGGAVHGLVSELGSLRNGARNEGVDYLFVVVDGAAPLLCRENARPNCTRYFVLRQPLPAWTIGTFNPAAPWLNLAAPPVGSSAAQYTESLLPQRAALNVALAAVPLPPFNGVVPFDTTVRTTCGGQICFAFQFDSRGEVSPVFPGAPPGPVQGFAFTVSSVGQGPVGTRNILVAFGPSGIVKTY